MDENLKLLREWVVNKIKSEYAEDVDLLIAVSGHSVDGDGHGECFDYFVPATERGNELSQTFIIAGVGHDLYPRSWERLEASVMLQDGPDVCLGNAEVIYARNEDARVRFEETKARFMANLSNPSFVYGKALERLDVAMDIYKTMMFEERLYQVRMGAGYIADYLNQAVAYLNGTFMRLLDVQEQVKAFEKLPENFAFYGDAIVCAESMEELKNLSQLMIRTTRKFIQSFKQDMAEQVRAADFADLAGWYQELSLAWRRLSIFCDKGDHRNAFLDACYLQSELNIVGEEFGLKEMDLLGSFNSKELTKLKECAKDLENYMIESIEAQGVKINRYESVQEFLAKQ